MRGFGAAGSSASHPRHREPRVSRVVAGQLPRAGVELVHRELRTDAFELDRRSRSMNREPKTPVDLARGVGLDDGHPAPLAGEADAGQRDGEFDGGHLRGARGVIVGAYSAGVRHRSA